MLWRILLWLNRNEVKNMAVIYVALILKEQVKEMLIDLELEDLITE